MDNASFRMLSKLTGHKSHTFDMEYIFSVIHESVVKSESLQLRRLALLEMKRRSGEQFTTTLCQINDAEEDCDISSYTVEDFRLYFRLHMCNDIKLKEELLKLGEEPGQLNLFTQSQKYKQRMQNFRIPTLDVTVSTITSNSEKKQATAGHMQKKPHEVGSMQNRSDTVWSTTTLSVISPISAVTSRAATTQEGTTTPAPMGYLHQTA